MTIAFKAAYQYNPTDKKDLKTVNSIINASGKDSTLSILSKEQPTDAALFTKENVEGFKEFLIKTGKVFGPQEATMREAVNYSHDKGVAFNLIQYTEQYEKLNFNYAKKALYAIGRGLRQIFR